MPDHALHPAAPQAADLLKRACCVIFDFDGVVADSETHSLETLRDTMADFGAEMSLEEVRAQFLGKSLTSIRSYVAKHGQTDPKGFGDVWQSRLYAAFRAELTVMPHLVDLLDHLGGANVRYCVASSSSFERLGVALEAMALTERFPNLFSAEQVTHGKPAPDLFLFAARHMDVAPQDCLVIEDSPYGIRAAKAAGIRAIGFTGGAHLRDCAADHAALLMSEGAQTVIDSLAFLTSAGSVNHEEGQP